MTLRCAASLATQSYGPLEVVVVDNGSSQANLQVLRRHLPATIWLVALPSNSGYAAGNNAGARAVAGMQPAEFVWILNNDIIVKDRGTAGRLVEALRSDPRRVAASPLINDPRIEGNPRARTQVRRVPGFVDMLVAYSSWLAKLPGLHRVYARQMYRDQAPYPADVEVDCETVNGSCFMARMDFVEEIGYLDEGNLPVLRGADPRLADERAGRHGCLVTGVIVDHFQGSTSDHGTSGFRTRMFLEEVRSQAHYARSYLRVSEPMVWCLYALRLTDYLGRMARHALRRKEEA